MNDETTPEKMTIGDQLLVDKLASGKASIGDLGQVLAKTYTQTDAQTQTLIDHGEKLAELKKQVDDHLTPSVTLLLGVQEKTKKFNKVVMGLVGFLGIGFFTWLGHLGLASSEKLTYLSKISDSKIQTIADAKLAEHDRVWEAKVDQKLKAQTDDLKTDLLSTKLQLETEIQTHNPQDELFSRP